MSSRRIITNLDDLDLDDLELNCEWLTLMGVHLRIGCLNA